MTFNEGQLLSWMATVWLPFARIGGAMITAPLFSAAYIPARVRILFAVIISAVVIPLLPTARPVNPLGIEGVLLLGNELLIGLAMGFVLQLVFDAIILGGQLIANGMGLGFAMMVDPQRGVQVPVLSQFLVIVCMLLFVAMDGHINFLSLLLQSFEYWPVADHRALGDPLTVVLLQGAALFAGAIQVAIPAIVALLVVQIAVGVVSRAAPTLNLFAVGFPLALLIGFIVLERIMPNLLPVLSDLMDTATVAVQTFLES